MARICGRLATISLIALFIAGVGTLNSQPLRNRRTTSGHSSKVAGPAVSTAAPPVLFRSTYLGGPGFEITWACAADKNGNVYIAGDAQSADFPVTANASQKNYGDGGQDGFIAKYDKVGNLLWSTYLGGSGWDGVFG